MGIRAKVFISPFLYMVGDKMEEINETLVNFECEPEARRFLTKKDVFGVGGLDADLIGISKEVKQSKKKTEYITYTLLVQLDEYTEYEITNVFRTELCWGKRANPKKVHITADKVGEFYNWKITPRD